MTTTELHEILDNENCKLTLAELKQVIYELKQDAFNEFGKTLDKKSLDRQHIRNIGFYDGEQNAFQIVLDLLEHLEKADFGVLCDKINLILENLNGLFPSQINHSQYSKLFSAVSEIPHTVARILNEKSITLPYLLCTSSKFACVIWRDKDGKAHKTYTMPIDEAKGVLKEKERI